MSRAKYPHISVSYTNSLVDNDYIPVVIKCEDIFEWKTMLERGTVEHLVKVTILSGYVSVLIYTVSCW